MAAAFVGCNLIVAHNGFGHAPLLIPTLDATLALLTAGMVAIDHSKPAGIVFGLFVLVEIVHVAAFQNHTQGTFAYFLTLNLLFLSQVAVVGGWMHMQWYRLADTPRMAARLHRGWLQPRPRAGRG